MILKDLNSPLWRLSSLYSIVDKKNEELIFTPNSIQKQINNILSKRKILLKARQFGVSTNEILKMFDFSCWNKNVTTCILAHEKDAVTKLFRIVRRAHDFMDDELRPELDRGEGSKYEFYFPSMNSRIYCDLESRGDTINWLHISEAAFVDDPTKLLVTMQAVPMDGIITIETTPNGMNWFYDYWNQDNGFTKHFFPWFLHEEYQMETSTLELTNDEVRLCEYALKKFDVRITDPQIAFRRFKQKELKHLFIQEYPEDDASCFLSSGNAACDLKVVTELLKNAIEPKRITKSGIKIFKERKIGSRYVCGADTSEGTSIDYSVGTVYESSTREQVAIIRGKFKPFDFAYLLDEMCHLYELPGGILPLLSVERNLHGHAVLLQLSEHIRYNNLYVHTDNKLGWLTDRVTRPIMIDTFIDGIENGTIKLTDSVTLQECLTLVELNGKIQAGVNKNDDAVIASAIATQLCIKMGEVDLYANIAKLIRV